MRILAIDYGRKKIGLAISDGPLAEPWKVIKVSSGNAAIEQLKNLVQSESIDKVVVGVSENKMADEQKKFSLSLKKKLDIPIETFDETLSSQNAQRLGIEAGISRKKRKGLEDAFAAAIILQNFLDSTTVG